MLHYWCKLFKERSEINMNNLQVINNTELIATPNLLNFQKYPSIITKLIIDNLTIEDIDQNITNLFEYAFGSEINIISNIAISEEIDIPKIIKDKYRLLNISINEENLNKDDIEQVEKNIKDLIIYYNIKKINLNIQDIDFIFKAEKLKKQLN